MRSLIVYDSQFGNTEQLAHLVARALIEFGPARAAHIHETALAQLRDIDLLIFGCPTQGWNPTVDMRTFIERLPVDLLRTPHTACFDTRLRAPRWVRWHAAPKLFQLLRKRGAEPFAPAISFFVKERAGPLADGEVERAAAWGRELGARVRETQRMI